MSDGLTIVRRVDCAVEASKDMVDQKQIRRGDRGADRDSEHRKEDWDDSSGRGAQAHNLLEIIHQMSRGNETRAMKDEDK
jgi:hypothetical protein